LLSLRKDVRASRLAIAVCAMLGVVFPGVARSQENGRTLLIAPAVVQLEGRNSRQQLSVTICAQDETVRDVTARCRYAVLPSERAVVDSSGLARPVRDGQGLLHVEFEGSTAVGVIRVQGMAVARPPGFATDIAPLLSKAGCNAGACHGNFNGKGGFRLSLRGDDPSFDLQSLARDQFGRRIDRIAASESLIVLKPTGQIAHEGGRRFAADSVEAQVLIRWIAEGARADQTDAPKLTVLRVFPAERVLAPGALQQQLVVTALFDDASARDVTRQATFDVSDPSRAEVTFDGRVCAKRPCETTIAIRYMNGRATSRLAFLPERPGFVWNGPEAVHPIDKLVFAKLRILQMNPSPAASDSVFIRRACLDAIGRLPESELTRAFLADRDPEKRAKLIDRLVSQPEFADFWALKWADLLRNEEKTMGVKGAWIFQRWLRDQIAADRPMDQLAREIVAGLGSTWRNPPASFHRTNRDPMSAAESVAQVFLGTRLQCARCHNHPFDVWTQDDYYGLAAFFANIERKQINNQRKDRLDSHEINGDELIYVSGGARMLQPRSGKMLKPRWLKEPQAAPVPEGDGDAGALARLADRLTRSNPQFSRNLANRVWFHLFGRGIVEPVDDFRESNPPSNPALLEAVSRYLETHGVRLRPLCAWIMKSQAYQESAAPTCTNSGDEANFSHALVRLLPAEALLDAISQVLDVPERFPNAPRSLRSMQLPGPASATMFLKTFGKPDRLLTCECERSDATTLAQAFQMISGETVRRKLESPDNRIGRRIAQGTADPIFLRELYLASLCREPSEAEAAKMLAHVRTGGPGDRRKNWEDIAWAIINSKEFLLRH
jgi:hypothetical protein